MNPFLRQPSAHQRTPLRAERPEPRTTEDGVVSLRLYDPIDDWGGSWGVSAREFVATLDELPENTAEIRLLINSPGGLVWEGLAILNALRAHPARVVAVVEGVAASAASFIAAGVDELHVMKNAELFIHNAWGLAMGNATDMTKMAADLAHEDRNIASIYAEKAGGTSADWLAAMAAETWYSAEEAVEAGLADRLLDPKRDGDDTAKARARFDLSVFAHAGRADAPAPAMPAGRRTPAAAASGSTTTQERSTPVAFSDEQLNTMRQRLGIPGDADEATIVAALEEALEERAEPAAAHTATVNAADEPWRAEAQRLSTELAEIKAERAREAKSAFFAEMSKTGRIKAADRAELERQYDEAPQVVRNIVAARAVGSEVPVAEIGYTGGTEAADPTDVDVEAVRNSVASQNWKVG